jgi:3-deoxy-D-manno-octulosonic acid (KDO) 8-phosphate synthase
MNAAKSISINGTIVDAHNDYDTGGCGTWAFLTVENDEGQCFSIRTTNALLKMRLHFGDRIICEARRSSAKGYENIIVGLKGVQIQRGAGSADALYGWRIERGGSVNKCEAIDSFFQWGVRRYEVEA